MLIRKTAVNYAKALFSVSCTREEVQKRDAFLEHLVAVIRSHPPVLQLLCYPELSADDRLKKIEEWLKIDLDPVLKQFLRVLIKRRMVNYLTVIASEYHKLVFNDLKSLDVHLESLEPLSKVTREKLMLKLENNFKKKINLIETLNPKLLSGFVLLVGNRRIDLSIKGKLEKLKKLILKGEV